MKGNNSEPEYRRRIREKAEQHQRQAKDIQREASENYNIQKIYFAITEVKKQLKQAAADDKAHNKGERRRNLWEIGGLWTAAGVGLIAIVVASIDSHEQRDVVSNQWIVMSRQLDQMRIAQRPWFHATPIIAGPMTIDEDEVSIPLNYILENSGDTPAFDAWIPSALMYTDENGALEFQDALCGASVLKQESSLLKTTVFPKERRDSYRTDAISRKIVNSRIAKGGDNPLGTWLVGCTDYKMVGDDQHHQSGFAYQIAMISEGKIIPISIVIGNIPSNNLVIFGAIRGGFRAY